MEFAPCFLVEVLKINQPGKKRRDIHSVFCSDNAADFWQVVLRPVRSQGEFHFSTL